MGSCLVVKLLKLPHCGTFISIRHLSESMCLHCNWLKGVGLQNTWIDGRMIGAISIPQPLFKVNDHINYGICSHLRLKEIILLFVELVIFAVLL